jgi:hypothetical protein
MFGVNFWTRFGTGAWILIVPRASSSVPLVLPLVLHSPDLALSWLSVAEEDMVAVIWVMMRDAGVAIDVRAGVPVCGAALGT